MKFCPICEAPNPEDRMICEQCGASLVSISQMEEGVLCSVCGYRNPSGTIFCEQCGARLQLEAMQGEGEPSGEAPVATVTAELDWVATLEGLFPEIPSEAQPPAPGAMPGGADKGEEITPPALVEEGNPPSMEASFPAPWERPEEEKSVPPALEPAPWMPAVEELPLTFELGRSLEETPISPPEGLPPEITEPWPLKEPLEEEARALPFPDVFPLMEGEEMSLPSGGEERLPFPWLETPGEVPEQGPEAYLPGTAPFIEGPLALEEAAEAPPQAVPFTEFPIETTEKAPEWPEWLRGSEGAEKPSEPLEEAVPEAPYMPFETWKPEASPIPTLELPVEEGSSAQASVFLIEEKLPTEAPTTSADVPPFTDLEAVLAEMPEWLQTLQPVPEEEGQAPSEAIPPIEPAVVETRGPLAGLVDVLPLNLRLTEIQGPAAQLRSEPSPELRARAQAWQSLLDQGLSFLLGERAAEPVPAGLGAVLERWLLFALLIGVLVLGLYWPLPFFQPALLIPPEDFLTRLDQAPSGGIALIAVDYGPDRAAELEIYLQRILERLTARGVRVLTVSLSPWGAAQAAQVVQARPDYGERVVHLGYYPGQEVGVARLFTRPLDQLGVDYRGQSLQRLPIAQDFGEDPLAARLSLVVLITGSPDALRGWIQQARGVLSPEVPMVAAVGANLAPYVAPYQESGQLHAVAIGLRDALLLDGPVPVGSPAFFDLQAQTLLQMFVVALIGVGLVIRLLRSPTAV
ncbi:zinc ribbon domain-containing protein [Thermoflexus sp.]|uniref:double zinc ribbon domain-containing protein n=1 Tax=Thermoflexus sp. TaxID=1969742 RepID=UPI0026061A12|nr:zinc ribbon domain-containing protein [Thermoflexus sp.]MCX7690332.1 zinc ribbon domain-containing protein [Thermoflexus sp.]